ncbi:MAG: NUDIX domain-containing protein [Candidatus Saccharimonas sp.]
MNTVLMPVAVVKDGDKVLLRKMDPAKSPYDELWALFGGRVESEASVNEALNKELLARWNFSVSVVEKLWWDEEIKVDHDGVEKRFVYLDAICNVEGGIPHPVNENETLEWVNVSDLKNYDINPPTKLLLKRLGYLE